MWNIEGVTGEPVNKKIYATGFKSVVDFKLPRSVLAAIGFYFFHLAILLLLSGVVGVIAAPSMGAQDSASTLEMGARAGHMVAFVYAVAVYVAIVSARKSWKNPWYTAALLATLVLAIIGSIFGLLPSAIILALKPKEETP
jgi:uncharacterized protein YacL